MTEQNENPNDSHYLANDEEVPAVFFDVKLNAWALPLGLTITFLLQKFWVFHHIFTLFASIPCHEMGHASAAWFFGRFALPIGAIVPTAGMTIIGGEHHYWVNFLYFSFFAALGYFGYRAEKYFIVTASAVFIFLSLYFMKTFSESEAGPIISAAGVAGEFLIASFLIISFYNPLFKKMRWDFFRYPFLVIGCASLTNALTMWLRIQKHLQSLPFGTAISADGSGDTNGDMNRLIQAGWTEEHIIQKYLVMAKIAVTLILLQYLYSLYLSMSKKD